MSAAARRRLALLFAAAGAASYARAATSAELSKFLADTGAKTGIVKPAAGILKYPYLVPAGPYSQLFDWDMYFMGVALSYDGVSQPVADSVRDFLEFVNEAADARGYAPREIASDRPWALPEQCKPFLAQAAVRAALTSGRWDWIRPLYPKLRDMAGFWEETRRAPNGLFVWYNGVESGADNSADDLKALVLKKMWFPHDGMFYNLNARTGRPIKVKAWSGFMPLWARMVSPDQARLMINDHLLSSREFWSAHGVRTLAADDRAYRPKDGYWRGPVWVVSNYIIMRGLLNYGYNAQARVLAQETVDLLVDDFKKSGGMNECYDPDTGAPAAGGRFVSWNLLAEHMRREAETGADPTAF